MSARWGIDLGGTKIEGVILDRKTEDVVLRTRISTEAEHGYEHILGRIALLVDQMERQSATDRPRLIGFGTPGTSDPSTGRTKNSNTTCLNNMPLEQDLVQCLKTQVVLANDANCFALAEARLGSARGAPVVFGVILGTGVGGGIVVDGKVLSGVQGICGEWGHNLLEPDGERCYCGKRGCVETVLSGPALERFYERRSGSRRPLMEIAERELVDTDAKTTVDRLVSEAGRGLAAVINILDPDSVVLGGGVSNVRQLAEQLPDALAPWVFNSEVRTKIKRPALGDSAGVFGAAMLVP